MNIIILNWLLKWCFELKGTQLGESFIKVTIKHIADIEKSMPDLSSAFELLSTYLVDGAISTAVEQGADIASQWNSHLRKLGRPDGELSIHSLQGEIDGLERACDKRQTLLENVHTLLANFVEASKAYGPSVYYELLPVDCSSEHRNYKQESDELYAYAREVEGKREQNTQAEKPVHPNEGNGKDGDAGKYPDTFDNVPDPVNEELVGERDALRDRVKHLESLSISEKNYRALINSKLLDLVKSLDKYAHVTNDYIRWPRAYDEAVAYLKAEGLYGDNQVDAQPAQE